MDNVPKIIYYVVSDLLKVKVTEAKKCPKNEQFSHIFKYISPLFDVIWFVYLIFLYAATLPYK